ncbi:MAG: dienelactone hydrolase family protein [Prosthecobacter sp.]
MSISRLLCLTLLVLCPSLKAQTTAPELPKVLLVGNASAPAPVPLVAQRLKGKAVVVGTDAGGLQEALLRERPAVVHFQAEPGLGEPRLQEILAQMKRETATAFVVAMAQENAAVVSLVNEAGVAVHDVRGLDEERHADAVADCVMRHWLVLHYSKPGPGRATGPEGAVKYRADEAAHDAEVPEMYKKLPIGKLTLPADASAWQKQRPEVLRIVQNSLGDIPPRPEKAATRVVSRELRREYTLERVSIDNGEGNDISALVLIPEKRAQPAPAVLWLHSSTPDKNALITPGTEPESIGEALVRQGYVVMAPDAWYYGDRAENVPSGPRDVYHRGVPPYANVTQDALLKLNLWLGRTLWGMMVRDDQIALDYLCQRPEVDTKRIGATGMSMGSTRSWWLAAVDERVAAVVGVACLTRYENLIRHGNLKAHGLYYFSYGLLKHFDTEGVLALIAPRPFLALTGDIDYGSPVDGIRVLEEKVGAVYRTTGAAEKFRSVVSPDTGHVYTPAMRVAMLAWFRRWLQEPAK